MNTGQRIAYLRERRGLSQAALGKLLKTSASAIGMWELGKRGLNDETLTMLANFFNVSTDYLLGLVDYPNFYHCSYPCYFCSSYIIVPYCCSFNRLYISVVICKRIEIRQAI